jgi:uncharacterized protein YcgI (DUF1989 family)
MPFYNFDVTMVIYKNNNANRTTNLFTKLIRLGAKSDKLNTNTQVFKEIQLQSIKQKFVVEKMTS